MQDIFTEPGVAYGDAVLAYEVGELLNKHYPGHMWAVNVDDRKTVGMVYIFNLAHSTRYGYALKIQTIYNDPARKCVIRAGGEILERAGQQRGWWNGKVPKKIEGIADNEQPLYRKIVI